MTISVGICTYKRPALLKRVLDSLLSQTRVPDEIIIFDSSEDDETERITKNIKSSLIFYFHAKKRETAPKGRNFILSKCSSDIIVFIDDDAIPEQKYIGSIEYTFQGANVSGVTGPTINSDEKLKPIVTLLYDDKNRTALYPWGEVRSDTRRWIPSRPLRCNVMIGANMSFRTEELRMCGGFDEAYKNPAYREETDPQVRILRNGKIFVYHPNVFVYHLVEKSGGIEDIESKRNQYFYLAGKNHRYFCDKYFPKWLTRLAWIFWNRTPPCLWLAFLLTIFRKENYLMWHRGLWEK